jgi:Protein of unknown function (DUF2000)
MDPVTVVTEDFDDEPMRCTIVIDAGLPPGKAANAAAVIGLTVGKLHPHLADASGHSHPGLIPIGISVLVAPATELVNVRAKALRSGLDVVDFPAQGQQTNDYAEFGERVRGIPTERLTYVGVGIYGTRKSLERSLGGFLY